MIQSFADKLSHDLFDGRKSGFQQKISGSLALKAQLKLDYLNSATQLDDLKVPPGNRLEKLKGTLSDFYSIRINSQWRIIFKWKNGDALDVKVIDYH